jgi:predicted nucleic acid-binding protein
VTRLLIDTSVLIKWFHTLGESEVAEARAIRDAHVRGDLDTHVLDLAVYEVGNVLVRALRWPAGDVADQLDDLLAITGPPMVMTQGWLRDAAALAELNSLSFYDASWAATAAALGIPLVSMDRRLLSAGVAETPSAVAARLRLPITG